MRGVARTFISCWCALLVCDCGSPAAGSYASSPHGGTLDDAGPTTTAGDAGPTTAAGDAGPPTTADDAGATTTADDAGPPTTTSVTDAGLTIITYRYPEPSDCDGLPPQSSDVIVASASYPVVDGGCPPPFSDESGTIALGTGGAYPIGTYALHENSAEARFGSPFSPNVPFQMLRGEPIGFSAAIQHARGWKLSHYSSAGTSDAEALIAIESGGSSNVAPIATGGYVVVIGSSGGSYTGQTVGLPTWTSTSPSHLFSADGSAKAITAQTDFEGHLFVEVGAPDDPSICPNSWFTLDGSPIRTCFPGYPKYPDAIISLLGSIAMRIPQDFPPDVFWIVPDPAAQASKAPDLVRSLAVIRSGLGYANWGVFCGYIGCSGDPREVSLLSRSGKLCAKLLLDDPGRITVTRDGTIVEQIGCSYKWFPSLLR